MTLVWPSPYPPKSTSALRALSKHMECPRCHETPKVGVGGSACHCAPFQRHTSRNKSGAGYRSLVERPSTNPVSSPNSTHSCRNESYTKPLSPSLRSGCCPDWVISCQALPSHSQTDSLYEFPFPDPEDNAPTRTATPRLASKAMVGELPA